MICPAITYYIPGGEEMQIRACLFVPGDQVGGFLYRYLPLAPRRAALQRGVQLVFNAENFRRSSSDSRRDREPGPPYLRRKRQADSRLSTSAASLRQAQNTASFSRRLAKAANLAFCLHSPTDEANASRLTCALVLCHYCALVYGASG